MDLRVVSFVGLAAAFLGAAPCSAASASETERASPEYVINSWGMNQGLPQSSVVDLLQTTDQFFWIGTFGGLVRFDGITFKTFYSGMTPGLSSNRIAGLAVDREGVLWAATLDAGAVSMQNGIFHSYTTRDGLPSNRMNGVIADSRGNVWLITYNGAVYHDKEGFHEKWHEPLPGELLSLAEGSRGRIWLGTNSGVVEVDNGRVASFRPMPPVLSIYADAAETVWAGTSRGLIQLSESHLERPWKRTPVTGEVRRMYKDRRGVIWVGAESGLWRFADGEWRVYTKQDGLSENSVRAILEDNEGNLWAGTAAKGLNRLTPRRVRIIAGGSEVPVNNTVPVLEDHRGALWIGLTCAGLVRYESGTYRLWTTREGLPNGCVWALDEDRAGNLWVGTRSGLALMHDGKIVRVYSVTDNGLVNGSITAVFEDRDGALWLGTGDGLQRLKNGVFTTYTEAQGLVDRDIRCILQGPDGTLWVGASAGVSAFRNGSFTNYGSAQGLPYPSVRDIYPDAQGDIWVATYGGGLARLRDGRFTAFDMSNGLPENIVSRIIEDDAGYLWLSGNRGIHRVAKAELNAFADHKAVTYSVMSLGTSDGMLSQECNGGGSPAGWKGRDGKIYFPTQRGIAVISPRAVTINRHPPDVIIEDMLVNQAAVNTGRPIRVPPGNGDLEIHYTAISPTAPEGIRFRYKLSGLGEEWLDAGSRRAAYYTHLPAGSYRFTVIAANSDGEWNLQGASIGFTVVPYLWTTWWFRLGLVGVGLVLGLAVYRARVRQLEIEKLEQMAFARRLIESQETERKRIASELHDSLGQTLAIIRNRAQLGLSGRDEKRASEQLDEIADAATHALEEVRTIAYNLRPIHLDQLGLAKSIKIMLRRASVPGKLRLTSEIDEVGGLFSPEEEIHVYRIAQEAVGNLLKHSGATEGALRIQRAADSLTIAVEDNGRGFHLERGSGEITGGLGLKDIAERAKLLNGHLSIASGERGTTIRITIPRKGGGRCRGTSA